MANKEPPSELIRASDGVGFDLWTLPSFDPDNEVVVEAPKPASEEPPSEPPAVEDLPDDLVKPFTLEELEAIREEAYNEGFATGEKDGFHSGHLKARQEADVALKGKLNRLDQVMGHLLQPIAKQDQMLEQAMATLISQMARQVIQRELTTDSSQISQVLREALKLLPMGAANVRIHLNPQDFELVKALRERHEESWRLLEDEHLLQGGCRVETEQSRIDASVETRLELAIKQLFEHQRAQASQTAPADISVDLNAPVTAEELAEFEEPEPEPEPEPPAEPAAAAGAESAEPEDAP